MEEIMEEIMENPDMDKTSEKIADEKISLIRRLKISTKILSGFGLVLVIMLLSSGSGIYSFITVGHDVEIYTEHVEQAAIASRIETEFLTLEIATEKMAFHLDGPFKE